MPDCPYYDLAPTAPKANLRWRARLREAAIDDLELRAALKQACFDDPLFFFMFAAWLIEPRSASKTIPFVLYPHQRPAIMALVNSVKSASLNSEEPIDVVFDKSRAQGATWICLYVILWFWLHEPMFAAGIISRNIEAVDKRNYPGSLFPKLDWAISMLPRWLLPEGFNAGKDRSQTDHVWHNRENGAAIVGTACTPEAFSGDRLTVVFYDEAAKVDHDDFQEGMNSIQHVTLVRWIVSTHYGDSGPFYEMVFGDAAGIKVVLDWKDNPSQNRLAYSFVNGRAIPLHKEDFGELWQYTEENQAMLSKLKRRGFVKEGRIRSPWYDRKCAQKGATPRGIAQDLDRDPRSTVGKMFPPEILDKMEKLCQPPVWQGDAIVRDGKLHLVKHEDGPLKLWFMPGLNDDPPRGRYAVAADIGTGITGDTASNSALSGGNSETGEQVLEYVNQLPEARHADVAVAICEWLDDAFLIWEAQGSCGKRFATRVVEEIRYWNVFKRTTAPTKHKNVESHYGWVNNRPAHKRDLFQDLYLAMDDEEFIPRSAEMILECRGWEEPEQDKIIYHGTGHGDRTIAAGLCHKGMKEISGIALDKPRKDLEDTDIGNAEPEDLGMAGRFAARQSRQEDLDDDMAGFRPNYAGAR